MKLTEIKLILPIRLPDSIAKRSFDISKFNLRILLIVGNSWLIRFDFGRQIELGVIKLKHTLILRQVVNLSIQHCVDWQGQI